MFYPVIGGDFSNRSATSPALFNRCVINWWGTWSEEALFQVAKEFTENTDLEVGVPSEMRQKDDDNKNGDFFSLQLCDCLLSLLMRYR